MKFYKDENGKPYQIESDYDEAVAIIQAKHNVTLTEVNQTEFDGIVTTINTPVPPTQAELDAQRVSEIDARLQAIDIESVRPLRAIANGTQTTFDTDKLTALDTEADLLRTERATLVPGV